MPEAVALHLVVAHLDDQLGPDACLFECARAPTVRLGRGPLGVFLHEREHLVGHLGPRLRRDRARAHVVELTVLAPEAEEKRRNVFTGAFPADPGDHAVGGLVLLHLHHPFARARQVRHAEPLCDHAVEPERLEAVEPGARLGEVAGGRGEPEALGHPFELGPTLLEWALPDRRALPDEHVEDDEGRRNLGREPPDPRFGRMEPHLHRVEVDRSVADDHDLAVER